MGIQQRKEREKEQRRDEILSAAQALFFSKGLQTATMDEIAARAEVSKGTLYLYYRSKEDLYLAVHMRGTDIMYTMFQQVLARPMPILYKVRELAEAYYRFCLDQRDYFRMVEFFESPHFHKQVSDDMLHRCTASHQRIWDTANQVIAQCQAEGWIHPRLAPAEVSVMVWACINGLFRQIDSADEYWQEQMGVNMRHTLQTWFAILMQAIMTRKAKRHFPDLVAYDEKEQG